MIVPIYDYYSFFFMLFKSLPKLISKSNQNFILMIKKILLICFLLFLCLADIAQDTDRALT